MTKDKELIKDFIKHCKKELGIQSLPHIRFIPDGSWVMERRSFGEYSPGDNTVSVYYLNRNTADVFRSLAHELVHHRQKELNMIKPDSGETGSEIENEAHAFAGIIMRDYGKLNPNIYEIGPQAALYENRLQEKIVKIPQDVLDKVDKLYDYIKSNFKNLSQKTTKNSVGSPHKLPKFQNYFQLKDLRADKKSADVAKMWDSLSDDARVDIINNTGYFKDVDDVKRLAGMDYKDVIAALPSTSTNSNKLNDAIKKAAYGIEIGVGVFNNNKDSGQAFMDPNTKLLIINLAHFGDEDDFKENIEHELVHAIDPKARDANIVNKLAHKDASPDEDYTKYIKSPAEFDAFTAPLINKLKYTTNKLGDKKREYITLLSQMLSDLKTQGYESVVENDKYTPLVWLFTKKEWNEENWEAAWNTYQIEISKISNWVTKPTLYKQFLKRLGTELA